jgi:uncharacterized protein (TIGR02453 family)
MITPEFLQFLYELSQNNNRDWFEKNKPRYEKQVKKPFEQLVSTLIQRFQSSFEPTFNLLPKHCIFRIYRDTRFSKDKTPYKNHVSASFAPAASKMSDTIAYPGYYFQIEFGRLMIGGGAYQLDKEPLHRVRAAIAASPSAFRELADDPHFREYYPEGLLGEKNKILPPEFKELAATEPMLYMKQFYFMAELDPEILLTPEAVDVIMAHFQAGHKLNDFFRKSVG